ncbi:MAG: hypothetical protein U9Q74_10160 [Gemmatimonadota bacterium]|nr:hypothetical protein [Gemmatimonadota bacterium]
MADDLRVEGSATVYRLYDVGYAIALDRAAAALGTATRGRARPERQEARALQIRNPPLLVSLGERQVTVGEARTATLAAHLYDFGVCSLRLQFAAPAGSAWGAFGDFAAAVAQSAEVVALFERELRALREQLGGAVVRPSATPIEEEFTVLRVDRIAAANGAELPPASQLLTDDHVARVLLGERRHLSTAARKELVPHRFSYYDDDLTVIAWENALVVEPRATDHDVEFVLEFANAQFLELRVYDGQLDAELPALYDRIEAARQRRLQLGSWRFRRVLSDLQTRVADITETVEGVDNALKVVDDVYLARIYSAALEQFRETAWRRGIERKLGILRDAYAMLNGEAQVARAEILEFSIVLLIVLEVVMAMVR